MVKPNRDKKRKQPVANSTQTPKEDPKATKQQRLSTNKKDIDDIFSAVKAKPASEQPSKQQPTAKPPSSKAPVIGSKDDLFGTQDNNARKRTEEGYAIYTEDELGLSKKGGDTAKCPFDCDCCY